MERAVGWARNQGLKVIIDLHGAPKSQNGFDHSGQKLSEPEWGTGDSIHETHKALWQIYQKYGNASMQDVVIGIQPLNEPLLMKLDKETVKQFYRDAFFTLRETSDTAMILHDGFLNPEWMNSFLTPQDNGAQGVIVDHHEYTIFDDALTALSVQERQALTCNNIDKYRNSDKWTIVGEWSGAVTDCAPHLNGYNQKSRFESFGVGNCWGKSGMASYWSPDYKDDIRRLYALPFPELTSYTDGGTLAALKRNWIRSRAIPGAGSSGASRQKGRLVNGTCFNCWIMACFPSHLQTGNLTSFAQTFK